MQLHVLEPLFKIFYTFASKNFSSCRLKFPGRNCRQKYVENLKQASGEMEFKHSYSP